MPKYKKTERYFLLNTDFVVFLFMILLCREGHAQVPTAPPPLVYSFGQNDLAQLGLGNLSGPVAYPLLLPSLSGPHGTSRVLIATGGSNFGLASTETSNQTAYSWGYGGSPETSSLGLGSFFNPQLILSPTALPLPNLNLENGRWIVSGGYNHTIAWNTIEQRLYVWGSNQFGQLGLSPNITGYSNATRHPEFTTGIRAASAGAFHTLVVTEPSGEVYAFGLNNFGQLGLGHLTNSYTPQRVDFLSAVDQNNEPDPPDEIDGVAAGAIFSLAWDIQYNLDGTSVSYGHLYLWGSRQDGRSPALSAERIIIQGPQDIQEARIIGAVAGKSTYLGHAFAWSDDGRLWAWGYNQDGQLGTGDKKNRPFPTPIFNLPAQNIFNNVRDVASGLSHTILVTFTGDIYTTGSNRYGQLGQGSLAILDAVFFSLIATRAYQEIDPQIGAGWNFTFFTDAYPSVIITDPPTIPTHPTIPPTLPPTLPSTLPPTFPPTPPPLTISPTPPTTPPPTYPPTFPPTFPPTNCTNCTFVGLLDPQDDKTLLIAGIILLAALLCCLPLLALLWYRRRRRSLEGELVEHTEDIEIHSPELVGINLSDRRPSSLGASLTGTDDDVSYTQATPARPVRPSTPPPYIPDDIVDESDSTEYIIQITPGSTTTTSTAQSPTPIVSGGSDDPQIELPSTIDPGTLSDSSQLSLGTRSPISSPDSVSVVPPYRNRSPPTTSAPSTDLSPPPSPGEQVLVFPGTASTPTPIAPSTDAESGSSVELVFPGGKPDDEENANPVGTGTSPSNSDEDEELVFNFFR